MWNVGDKNLAKMKFRHNIARKAFWKDRRNVPYFRKPKAFATI